MELDKIAKSIAKVKKYFIENRDAANSKWISRQLKKTNKLAVYTLNNITEVMSFINEISEEDLSDRNNRLTITTDNITQLKAEVKSAIISKTM